MEKITHEYEKGSGEVPEGLTAKQWLSIDQKLTTKEILAVRMGNREIVDELLRRD